MTPNLYPSHIKIRGILLSTLMLFVTFLYADTPNIKRDFRAADPVSPKDSLKPEGKMKVYRAYLDRAILDKDITKQFYAHIFLYNGYYNELHDYKEAAASLLRADSLAVLSGHPAWSALVELRKGALDETANDDHKSALAHYRKALDYAIQAGDSLCEGESLEQVSAAFVWIERADSAHYYMNLAFPLLRKHADTKEMALVYNNYSLLLDGERRFDEALLYSDSAIALARANKDMYKELMYRTNKASFYTEKGEPDNAIPIYNECIAISKANNFPDRLQNNYIGLMQAFEKKGDFHAAYDNLMLFYLYKDSLTNAQVQLTIAELTTKSDAQKKQIALDKANETLQVRTFILIVLSLLAVAAFVLWYFQSQAKKKEITLHQENLQKLTQMLTEKNAQLASMEQDLPVATDPGPSRDASDFENSLYNKRILTYEDWFLFKAQFEKAYPGYLPRLKKAYPSLTEAEERMFLLVKLKLKSKEISAILGISTDAVKKTRARLRKRLELAEDVDLDSFILSF